MRHRIVVFRATPDYDPEYWEAYRYSEVIGWYFLFARQGAMILKGV